MYNGTPVVELSVNDFNGTRIVSPLFKDRCGFLKVYAPWCGHCQNMHDDLINCARILKRAGFVVSALNADNHVNKPVAHALNVRGFPTLFFVDYNGNVMPYDGDRDGDSIAKAVGKFCKNVGWNGN